MDSVRINLDRAFQNLFSLVSEVVALFRQRENIDGPSTTANPKLMDYPPLLVDNRVRDYKTCFDSTPPDVHVDGVLELYSKVRQSVLRGYMCNSWLTNSSTSVSLYYGVNEEAAGSKVVHLDCVAMMLDSLSRGNTQFRSTADLLRYRFAVLLYGLFEACLKFTSVVSNETNIPIVTPPVPIEDELNTLSRLKQDIVADMPKTSVAPVGVGAGGGPGAANPFAAGLASMLPAGMNINDLMKNFVTRLPEIANTVTENVSRMTGIAISDQEKKILDNALSNVSDLMSNPDEVSSLVGKFAKGSGGISEIAEMLLKPKDPPSTAKSAGAAPPPPPEGPAQD